MRGLAFVASSVLCLSACVTPPEPPEVQAAYFRLVLPAPTEAELAEAEVVHGVRWIARPSRPDYLMAYPRDAWFAEAEATVRLSCIIQADGTAACAASDDKWPQYDFEQAARNVSSLFRVGDHALDGTPTAGRRLDITIAFILR